MVVLESNCLVMKCITRGKIGLALGRARLTRPFASRIFRFPLTLRGRFDAALEKERNLPRPSLVRACRSSFGREFLKLGWLKAVNTGLGFFGPLLLKVVVDAVQDASDIEGDRLLPTTVVDVTRSKK